MQLDCASALRSCRSNALSVHDFVLEHLNGVPIRAQQAAIACRMRPRPDPVGRTLIPGLGCYRCVESHQDGVVESLLPVQGRSIGRFLECRPRQGHRVGACLFFLGAQEDQKIRFKLNDGSCRIVTVYNSGQRELL